METGETDITVNTDMCFDNNYLLSSLSYVFNNRLKSILQQIANVYDINEEELVSSYLISGASLVDINTETPKRKRKKNKQLQKDELCMARKADNAQCTRRRKDNMEFCGKHCNNLKFGRIDDEEKYSNNDNFIMCSTEEIDGVNYLVDGNQLVYSLDFEHPEILGKKSKDGKLVPIEELKSKIN